MGGLQGVIKAFFYSVAGLRYALGERAFRQELALAAVLAPLGLWLGRTPAEQALLVGCLLIVLALELLNSAIEAAVDRVGREHDPLSGRAKDLASAAVFIAIIHVIFVWIVVAIVPRTFA